MSTNQLHGLAFEEYLLQVFPGAKLQDTFSQWDLITADETLVSVKTTKNTTVCLSDARRFWQISKPFKLIVGVFSQVGDTKVITTVYEFQITEDVHKALIDGCSYDDIESFHEMIQETKFEKYFISNLRDRSKDRAAKLSRHCWITLNPKIGSGLGINKPKQRRIQCSITLQNLCKVCKPVIYNKVICIME